MRYITINITLYNSCVMRKENGMGEENLNCQIRRSDKYNMWRLMVLGRDNFTCQFCGARGVYLFPHHLKAFSLILKENNITTLEEALKCEELWDLNNGVTLCNECHKQTPNFRSKALKGIKRVSGIPNKYKGCFPAESNAGKILETFKNNPQRLFSPTELSKELNIDLQLVHNALTKLKNNNLVENVGYGKWKFVI